MRVIGIGGIFFKSEQPEKLSLWYKEHLGIGTTIRWKDVHGSPRYTVWNVFSGNSKLFEGTKKALIVNYIVDELEGPLKELKNEKIDLIGKIEKDENGSFAYVLDPEGNKIILWQPSEIDPGGLTITHEKVTGLGGVFFKSPDPKKLSQWYARHLGLDVTEWGCNFLWHDPNNLNERSPAITVWNPFAADTTYFNPSKSDFMLNYRVLKLVELLKKLESSGIQLAGAMEEFSYGKFAWIIDPDGNKIELWEPIDDGF